MTKFFFLLAWRNIKNNLLHSIVNTVGLAVGICAFMFIALFLQHIFSKDKFNENHERLFILQQKIESPANGIAYSAHSPFPLAEALSSQYPEIEKYTRFIYRQEQLQLEGKNKIIIDNGIYADSAFNSLLTLEFLAGDSKTALKEPNSIILNESIKQKLFGDIPFNECIGKTVILTEKVACKVTAIITDHDKGSFWYNFIVSMPTLNIVQGKTVYGDWEVKSRSILFLKKDIDYNLLNKKISPFLKNHNDLYENNTLFLLPLKDNFLNNPIDTKIKKIVMMVVILTIFILSLSFLNFINLRYANAITRIKETSLKKVLGSKRFSVILQWAGESALITFIAFDLAAVLTELLLPAFNAFINYQLEFICVENWKLILSVLSICIFTGIISGTIPALKISSLNLSDSLQNQFKSPKSKLGVRKALLIFQISLTVIFISAMIIMRMQLNYHINKDKGFDEKRLLTYSFLASTSNRKHINEVTELAGRLKENANINQACLSSAAPFIKEFYDHQNLFTTEQTEKDKVAFYVNHVDSAYFEILKLKITEGRKFEVNDYRRPVCVINETAKQKLGLSESTEQLLQPGNIEIIGVVKDYHFGDMNWPIRPLILLPRNDTVAYKNNVLLIRIPEQNSAKTKSWIINKTATYLPEEQVEYNWLEDLIPYDVVHAMSLTFRIFSFIAICLSVIGLFGMVSYTTIARSKEIGIRKALGASTLSIFSLLLKSHVRLVVIANLISWPIAYFLMKTFLQFSAYRINISPLIFIATGLITFLIMLLTVGYHILKAARTNPVKELRDE